MKIKAVTTGAFEEICYIIWSKKKQALIFDPGHDAALIANVLEDQSLTVAAYVCTHGHSDHINALAELHTHHPAPVLMHSNDWKWAFDAINQIAPYYPVPKAPPSESFQALEQSETWTFADLHFKCMETPGHTPGSCCLLFPVDRILISGDTLFKGSCGRTDLPNGDPRALKESLNKLKDLSAQTHVYPGHGPDTTIGIERATNFFMK